MAESQVAEKPVEQPSADVVTQTEAEQGEQAAEEQINIPQVTVRLPTPSHSRTLPKRTPSESFTTLTLLPQPHETVQELKLAINEWVGGYWLGPYSLRIPATKGQVNGHGDTPSLSKTKEGVDVRAGEKLSEWIEVGDLFAHVEEDGERILEVVREPYSDFSARQTVLRLLELIIPPGSSINHMSTPLALLPGSTIFESVRDGVVSAGSSEPVFEEVEVALPSGRKGKLGKKEVVKVKREVASDSSNPFADWKGDWRTASLAKLPLSQAPLEVSPCVRSIQLSPFNPPPPHLRQLGHQLYLQVSLLEGETITLVCSSRGWYVSKSNVNNFDPTPRPSSDGSTPGPTHSLIDLLHSLSPQFSERLSQLAPLSTTPPPLEPLSTVPIPQSEPAYPFLATTPAPPSVPELLRTQLAYLHTGATTADALDATRDWNEEIQGVKELPHESMQERVLREKMAQKTWAEFTQASVRGVMGVARGDIPPLNPNEDSRGHMWLVSNIFITRAIDCIDTYAHLGGDDAAYISHAKDAAGVKLLNKLDVDGLYLLGHTVVDWQGERWVCQSMLPGIFSRRKEDDAVEETPAESEATKEKKEDWVKVQGHSPSKSIDSDVPSEEKDEPAENPLIIYGIDSEDLSSLHWDEATHKIMEKVATACRLAPHQVKAGNDEKEFYASAEVKALRGTDGRRYLLDLPRLSPVDVEWLEKDISGKLAGPEKDVDGSQYPHRVVLLRPELIETFWESELKRWARGVAAAEQAKKDAEKKESGDAEDKDKAGDASATEGVDEAPKEEQSPAAEAAAAHRAEENKPVDASAIGDSIKQFELRFNPDAFVDQAPARDAEDKTAFTPSKVIDESDPTIKAVRDASVFLRTVALPAIALDVLTGNVSGVMDGASLSKLMHSRGVNMRYLGHLAATIAQFSAGPEGEERPASGHLSAFKGIVLHEMVFRASKHILRRLVRDLQPEHVPCAVSHFLNCLLGSASNPSPSAVYEPIDFASTVEPEYVSLTAETLRSEIVAEVQKRYRWCLDDQYLTSGLRRKQLLRELASRFAFQLVQQDFVFERVESDAQSTSEDDKETKETKSSKDKKKKAKAVRAPRQTTFEPSDILTLVPVIKSTAPSVSVAEEIFEAGRNTINRGNIELGLEFMLEAVQLYENIHSVIHPEVAAAYNQYASTLHQLARLKIQQFSNEQADPEQPLGLDIATGLRLQRQAIIIAERTLGVYNPETTAYYFNLALLENLEGNAQQSLRYFRHILTLWDVIHGPGHPEINTVLSNAGVVLQAINENALSLALLSQAQQQSAVIFGTDHIQNGQALHQLTQAHFLAGDIPKALETSKSALEIFEARLSKEHAQTKEVAKNVELLTAVVENVEKQKQATQQAKERQLERLRAAQARVASTDRRRLATGTPTPLGAKSSSAAGPSSVAGVAGVAGPGEAGVSPSAMQDGTAAAQPQEGSRIGERGHLDVDELVKFIQGQGQPVKRSAKNALRGKRRTGAKR